MTTTSSSPINTEAAQSILEWTIRQSQAENVFVSLEATESALSRFSDNQISQNVNKNQLKLTITSYFGRKSATAATTSLESEAIATTLRNCETLARLAPEDPEWVPLLPPQAYSERQAAFDLATVELTPLARGEIVQKISQQCQQAGVKGSGTFSTEARVMAIANSAGLIAASRTTSADYSFTAKINNGSSWNQRSAWAVAQIPVASITDAVIQRAIAAQDLQTPTPGDYTVIFTPAAASSLVPWIVWNLDARAADEGRSFMSKEGGNRVGEKLFNPIVNIRRNATHPLLQTSPFLPDGIANTPLEIVKDGIPQTLAYSRYWAQQQQLQPTGWFYPIVMSGSEGSIDDLIASTAKGILVSRAWYVRYVNPRTLEVTGMTRDGTFAIENGQISHPIKNMRFNQCLPQMLAQVEAVGQVERCGNMVIPAIKVNNFHFSSITDSI